MVLSNLGVQIVMAVETFKLFAACSDLLRIFFVGKIWPSCVSLNTYGIAMLPIKYSILPVNQEIQLFFVDLLGAFLLVINSSKSTQTCPKKFFWSILSPSNQIWSYCYHVDISKRILPIANCWKYSLIVIIIINRLELVSKSCSKFRPN